MKIIIKQSKKSGKWYAMLKDNGNPEGFKILAQSCGHNTPRLALDSLMSHCVGLQSEGVAYYAL